MAETPDADKSVRMTSPDTEISPSRVQDEQLPPIRTAAASLTEVIAKSPEKSISNTTVVLVIVISSM
jgi:hypothetical protein